MRATIEVDDEFFAEKAALTKTLDWHDVAEVDEPVGLFRVARKELERLRGRVFALLEEKRDFEEREEKAREAGEAFMDYLKTLVARKPGT